ncbi:MAG: metallophosphoesterase [Deltaproteobacteria bacterium]|nr:metallophosphoesterase [Deltaproteobacteria bacterium]
MIRIGSMERAAAQAALWTLVVLLAGCAHRLKGPNYGADSPPWIAPDLVASRPMGAKASESGPSPADIPPDASPLDRVHRVVLIGDAGYYLEDDPTLAALARWTADAERSSVVFLGDNIYDEGMTDEDRARGEKILGHQLAATRAAKYVIPGNHDWGFFSKKYNAKSINNQQLFVDGWPAGRADFVPKDGCMGPELRTLAEADGERPAVVLIALDPTPWIHPRLRALCSHAQTTEAHLARLAELLAASRDDFVIVASHYPMRTGGPHGGLSYGFVADLFVTPLGWLMGGLGNTYEPGYADWIAKTEAVLRGHPPELYAAGHDHNLQLLDARGAAGLYVVSGAGAVERVSTVTPIPETRFAHAVPGFVAVEFGLRDGRPVTRLRVVESTAEDAVFEMELPVD